MKISLLAVFALQALAWWPRDITLNDLIVITDGLLFNATMQNFTYERTHAFSDSPDRPFYRFPLDWNSDGCSFSPDRPLGFDFEPPCQRHDFGYRNYKRQGRWNETNRANIDNNLYDDMIDVCTEERAKKVCSDVAKLYFEAVRKFGNNATKVQREMEGAMVVTETDMQSQAETET